MNAKIKEYTLDDVCYCESSNIAQKDLEGNEGNYPIFGASGLIKNVDFYKQDKEYIAVVKDGAGIGKVFILPKNSSIIGTLQYILPKYNTDIKYLYYAMVFMNLSKYFSGSTIPHIYFKTYKKEKINLPTIDIQVKRASILSKIDEIINKYEQLIEKHEILIKSRFVEMFDDCNLSLNKSNWVQLKDIAEIVGGATPKTSVEKYWNGTLPWITPAEISDDKMFIDSCNRYLTQEGVDSCSLKPVPKGTILLTSRAPIGKLAIALVPLYCNQGFKNIVCGSKLNNIYLYYLFKMNVDYLNSLGRGSTFNEISKSIVEKILIPLPDYDRQVAFSGMVKQINKSKFIDLEYPINQDLEVA